MNPHFTLFRYAMTRPGDAQRSHRGAGASVAALLIGAVVVAAIAIPLISG